ncbi:integrase core domain-containing protein, partial [Lacticaseibacillus paracasei]|uniref:integrase core domain-containing protein n=1 Tax=Lacticaseibacillus paracasei TaxID=1597 RepID=UPI0025A2A7BB
HAITTDAWRNSLDHYQEFVIIVALDFKIGEVETLLERHQISHSYSKQGYPYDNGPIEAFHSLLKREFAFQTTFSNFEDLVIRTSNYISWFNSDRIRTSV